MNTNEIASLDDLHVGQSVRTQGGRRDWTVAEIHPTHVVLNRYAPNESMKFDLVTAARIADGYLKAAK